jgi:hypothetical protein
LASSATPNNIITGNTHVWITGTTIGLWSNLRPFGSGLGGYKLVRGCTLNGFRANIVPEVFMGNRKTDKSLSTPSYPSTLLEDGVGSASGPWESVFIVDNELMGIAALGFKYWDDIAHSPLRGLTVYGNLAESVSNATQYGLFHMSASDQYNLTFQNAKVWHNTFMGERHFICYNSSGTQPVWYHGVSMVGNIAWEYNIKDNNHFPASANRIGNWSLLYGVGYSGNLHVDSGGNDQFNNRWAGINTRQDVWGTNFAFYDFLDYKATIFTNDPNALGLGNYRLGASSPARDLLHVNKIAYDLDGNLRGLPDDAGAYSSYTTVTPGAGTVINANFLRTPSFKF